MNDAQVHSPTLRMTFDGLVCTGVAVKGDAAYFLRATFLADGDVPHRTEKKNKRSVLETIGFSVSQRKQAENTVSVFRLPKKEANDLFFSARRGKLNIFRET